jgi:IS605 OrfB family transposase
VRIRTRIHVTDTEGAALAEIGGFLGGVYRSELAGRLGCGVLDREGRARWRTERKQAITVVASSRWAGAITRTVEDQYQLGMRALAAHEADLRKAVEVLAERCALRPGERTAVEDAVRVSAERGDERRRRRGYRSAGERFTKTRRLAILRQRLATAEASLAAGRPSVVVGGKRLWRTRNYLEQAGMNERCWRKQWDAARMFLTADGESGKAGGNETIRVDTEGRLQVKVPGALAQRFGSHVVVVAPVMFAHRGGEWATRVAARRAVRYDIHFDPGKGRWYLDASWKTPPQPAPQLDELRAGRVLGVDLNADHLASFVLDSSGNPVGDPTSIEVATTGLSASRRDGRVRAAITVLLDLAQENNCAAVVIENLDFADARAAGRETLGRGQRGKRLRRTIAGIPTARFRMRLTAMAHRRGIAVIGVDAAYTSKWGERHWRKPLQQQTSGAVTRHHAAAAAIGRRGLGLAIRRRPAGPRNGQWTAAGTPPARPDHLPSTTRRHGSSGPPTHPIEARRSTGEHPPPAANTVRAATWQDSPLRSNQER